MIACAAAVTQDTSCAALLSPYCQAQAREFRPTAKVLWLVVTVVVLHAP